MENRNNTASGTNGSWNGHEIHQTNISGLHNHHEFDISNLVNSGVGESMEGAHGSGAVATNGHEIFVVNDGNEEDVEPPQKKKRVKSQYKGVFKCGKKFKAQIQTHGVQHYLGLFETEEEAARAYDTHARFVLGLKAKTNFPIDPREIAPAPFIPFMAPLPTNGSATANRQEGGESSNNKSTSPPVGNETHKATLQTQSEDSNDPNATTNPSTEKSGRQKRVYVGMKMRKKTVQEMLDVNKQPSAFNPINYITNSMTVDRAVQSAAHTLLHLPLPLAQSSYLMNNVSANSGYSVLPQTTQFLIDSLTSAATAVLKDTPIQNIPSSSGNKNDIDWSKQAYTPLEITGTTSNTTASEPDWREQIYYWTGKLDYDNEQNCLVWKGKWLGSFTGKPNKIEFETSNNEFTYCSQNQVDKNKVILANNGLMPISGYYKGYYMMDNDNTGDLLQYEDKELLIEFDEIHNSHGNSKKYKVYAKGDSEFGAFIIYGHYDAQTKLLEMNRQYLAENDLRKTMNLAQLKIHFKRSMLA